MIAADIDKSLIYLLLHPQWTIDKGFESRGLSASKVSASQNIGLFEHFFNREGFTIKTNPLKI